MQFIASVIKSLCSNEKYKNGKTGSIVSIWKSHKLINIFYCNCENHSKQNQFTKRRELKLKTKCSESQSFHLTCGTKIQNNESEQSCLYENYVQVHVIENIMAFILVFGHQHISWSEYFVTKWTIWRKQYEQAWVFAHTFFLAGDENYVLKTFTTYPKMFKSMCKMYRYSYGEQF